MTFNSERFEKKKLKIKTGSNNNDTRQKGKTQRSQPIPTKTIENTTVPAS